jgi:hypothetical protein
MERLRQRRVFYRHGDVFYLMLRRVGRGDSSALLLLILESTLPLIEPSANSAVSPLSTLPATPPPATSLNDVPTVSVVIDGLLFSAEHQELGLMWFLRLRDLLQPVLQSSRIDQVDPPNALSIKIQDGDLCARTASTAAAKFLLRRNTSHFLSPPPPSP